MFIVTERFILLNTMYRETDIIYEAVANLEEFTGLKINVETNRREYDAVIQIDGQTFYVEAKANARKSNIGMILSQLEMQDKNKEWLLIADYLAKDVAEILQKENHNYLDVAGNASIKTNNLFIFIEGKKKEAAEKKNQSRAFQEAGLKLLLFLISDPENLQMSYRELAEKSYKKYYANVKQSGTAMPNVVGLPAMDAVAILENLGLKVQVIGFGKVTKQSVANGEKITKQQIITLELS
jgi:hypothetical protein